MPPKLLNAAPVVAEPDAVAMSVSNRMPGPAVTSAIEELDAAQVFVERIAKNGPNPAYMDFALSTMAATDVDAFTFIRDAVDGTGGFSDGSYIVPHLREMDAIDPKTGTGGTPSRKYDTRRRLADYDNFARTVCDSYWGYIAQSKDEIRRRTDVPVLDEFWRNADLQGTDVVSFMATAAHEARMFGWAAVFIDMPDFQPLNQVQERQMNFRPYAWVCETQNIVDWVLDDDGILLAIAVLDPPPGARRYTPQYMSGPRVPIRVWSRNSWSRWVPVEAGDKENVSYEIERRGLNPLGEIPVVFLYNSTPPANSIMGSSEMREVALVARTVYNIDSEMRELERNCAFPVLTMPSKNPASIRKLTLSTEGALSYNSALGQPAFLQPSLESLVRLQERREKKVAQAFGMAHLEMLSGYVQTTSGFHQEAVFDRTNQQIGRFSAAVEDAENKAAYFVLRWVGASPEEAS